MFTPEVYHVAAADKFNAHNYPAIVNELICIKAKLSTLSSVNSVEMVISFFKDHRIRCDMAEANPRVFDLVSSGSLSAKNIEMLFVGCKDNMIFLKEFEAFIIMALVNSDDL